VGVNIHSEQGKELVRDYNIPGAPYMAVMYFDEKGTMQNIGCRFAEEINVNSIFDLSDTAMSMMSALFDPVLGISEFNIADSNLERAETEEVKQEIMDRFKEKQTTGFVESRRREPEIDVNTGLPVGMTDKQVEDRLLKDKQNKEIEEAKEKDKLVMEQYREKQQEEKQRQKEDIEHQAKIEQLKEEKKEIAESVKQNLPEEPSEDNKDACTVQFRLPDGSKTIQRRFLKTERIQMLYDYIISFGNEEGFEAAHTHFSILQNFPKKIYEDMNKTLEEEGLYPRCKLYVREHSHSV
jgi:hypothetical protein